MRRIRFWVLLILLLVGLGVITGFFLTMPRLVSTNPGDGAEGVFPDSPIQMTFAAPVQTKDYERYFRITPEVEGVFQQIGAVVVFTPLQPWSAGETIAVEIRAGLRSRTGIPLLGGRIFQFKVKHPWLLFLLPATGGGSDLYRYDTGSIQIERLAVIPGGIDDYNPAPDGSHILYWKVNAVGGTDVYRYDLNERETTRLTDCDKDRCGDAAASPDGQWLAYTRQNTDAESRQTVWVEGMGTTQQPAPTGNGQRAPVWSVDSYLAFYDPSAVGYWVIDPVNQETRLFNNSTGERGTWSPDGSTFWAPELVYSNRITGGIGDVAYSSRLMRFARQSGEITDMTRNENLEDLQPVFAPNGQLLAFARRFVNAENWTPGRQIWLAEADGTTPRPLTNEPLINHSDLAWSPDAAALAVVRFNTANLNQEREIWLMDILTGNAESLVVGGYHPAWIP